MITCDNGRAAGLLGWDESLMKKNDQDEVDGMNEAGSCMKLVVNFKIKMVMMVMRDDERVWPGG